MTYRFTTSDDNDARMIIQAYDAHIALIKIEAMLRKYRKSDTIEYENLMTEYYDITEDIWLPE